MSEVLEFSKFNKRACASMSTRRLDLQTTACDLSATTSSTCLTSSGERVQHTYQPSIRVDVIIQYICVNRPHLMFIAQNTRPPYCVALDMCLPRLTLAPTLCLTHTKWTPANVCVCYQSVCVRITTWKNWYRRLNTLACSGRLTLQQLLYQLYQMNESSSRCRRGCCPKATTTLTARWTHCRTTMGPSAALYPTSSLLRAGGLRHSD